MSRIRSPIVSVLGHVDHGKSSLLDAIRDTDILKTEAGAITQAIGASIVPAETIERKCGNLLKNLGVKLTIPGLLFIDTPGHAAFTSLRKRGGSLADIAVVVVDINEGFKPQTYEAIEVLRAAKTPFIIAANKLDVISGFNTQDVPEDSPILGLIGKQSSQVQQTIESRMYELVGQLYDKFNLTAERFDRVEDFTKQVAIVPISALEKLGVQETLMVLGALAQKYLEKHLSLDVSGPAKGSVLEIKEERGLGKSLDVIIYNGTLRVGDTVVIGGLENAHVARVRALFEPDPHSEMRDKKSHFTSVKEVSAATGVRINCPDLGEVFSGMPIISCENTSEAIDEARSQVQAQVDEVIVETDREGIILKADNIGSLEALSALVKEKGIPVRKASIGPISKKDVADAESNFETDPLNAVILGFNIPDVPSSDKVRIITDDVIYAILDRYDQWLEVEKKRLQEKQLEGLTKPCKVEILNHCIFRQSNPCVFGVEVLSGTLRTGMELMKAGGDRLSVVKSIQDKKESVSSAEKGKQVAISMHNITAGRHISEGDILYTNLSPNEYREFKKHRDLLSHEEKELLKEIAEIKRREDTVWGV
ncbi:MAG: translation initiation factor IF-2 [Candidatus Woesearchaeota archaeon]